MDIEKIFVQDVYDRIADEFSNSRYRPWVCVEDFLDSIPENAKIADIGCGNGKAMLYKNNVLWSGIDNSKELCKICENRGLNVKTGDILDIPFEDNVYDYTICIAVIHHLSTQEKRLKAVSELVRITKKSDGFLYWFGLWNNHQIQEGNSLNKRTILISVINIRKYWENDIIIYFKI